MELAVASRKRASSRVDRANLRSITLEEAKRLRAQAIADETKRAKELKERTLLKEVIADLGPEAFTSFRETVTNEPKTPPKPANPGSHAAKNRVEKMARKVTRRSRK